jgi:phospholipid/cholesterol/gamma-HCH transport system substrate-binding protein
LESKTNYTVVGLIVLILLAGLLSAALWLSIGFDNKKYDIYTIYMKEAATGLSDDSIVKYNGVKVGMVSNIELNPFDPQQVKIQLNIVQGTPITASTQATLINQGITGNTYLGLSATSPSLLPIQKTPGELYPVIPYKPSFLGQLQDSINDISSGFKRIFDKENARSFKKTLLNLQKVSDVIAQNNQALNESLKGIPELVNDLKLTVKKFSSTAADVSSASKQVSITMQSGRNTIDKITQQAVPPAVLLLQRMDAIAANLEQLSNQIRQNPAVVIRGSSPPLSGPGE